MTPPRKPGSQVAPGQKPLFRDGRTAAGHSKIPIEQATAGKLYRVRDKHTDAGPGKVWGDNLAYADAVKEKDRVAGSGASRTVRVEPMDVAMPQEDIQSLDDMAADIRAAHNPDGVAVRDDDGELVMPTPGLGSAFELAGDEPQTVPSRGVIMAIPPGHELLIDGQVAQVPAIVQGGETAQARALDHDLAAAREAALAAARPFAQASRPKLSSAYRDKTIVVPAKRTKPVPRDRTVSKAPLLVRLGAPPSAPPAPPPSPLKVATQLDGEALDENALSETDLHDLGVDGGASDADHEHATRERDAGPVPSGR